jgi:hypothetical protein
MSSPQVECVRNWLDGIGARNVDAMEAEMAAEFNYRGFPASLGARERTAQDFIAILPALKKIVPRLDVRETIHQRNAYLKIFTVHHTRSCAGGEQSVVPCKVTAVFVPSEAALNKVKAVGEGKLADGTAFRNEFVFMTKVTEEDGKWKLAEVKEFADSITTSNLLKSVCLPLFYDRI